MTSTAVLMQRSSVLRLVSRSLADPAALSLRAWVIPLPMIIVDALCLELLLTPIPQAERALALGAVAAAGYLLAGAWLLAARRCRRRVRRVGVMAWISLAAWMAVGATWGATLMLWIRGVAPTDPPDVSAALVVASTGLMQVVFAMFVAVVLHAHREALGAQEESESARRRYFAVEETMSVVHVNALRGFRVWIDDVLAPAVDEALLAVREQLPNIAEHIGRVREQVVHATSRRLHPRTVSLGTVAALRAVVVAHGRGDDITFVEVNEVSHDQTACLARCLDVIVAAQRDERFKVCVWCDEDGAARMRVSNGWEAYVAAGAEVPARVDNLNGTVQRIADGVLITVPNQVRDRVADRVVQMDDLSLPRSSAFALVVPTVVVMMIVSGVVSALIAGALAATCVAVLVKLMPVDRVTQRSGVTVGIVALALTAALTSAVVTGVWLAFNRATLTWAAIFTFWLANAIVIVLIVTVVTMARARVGTWAAQVATANEISNKAELAARSAIREVDRFREEMASTLHSQVQARLLVAESRLLGDEHEGTDTAGALRALATVREVDIVHLRDIVDTGARSARTIASVKRVFADVDIEIEVSEEFSDTADSAVVAVIHEALINAVRHGGATRVSVQVTTNGPTWSVQVSDNGIGVDTDISPGLGFALVDAASQGRWSLDAAGQGGARMHALVDR